MNKKLLVISLFVHDMKAPLAVIGSGAKRLRTHMIQSPYGSVGRGLVEKILFTKGHASQLLNEILGMDAKAGTGGGLSYGRKKVPFVSSFFSRVKTAFLQKKVRNSEISLYGLIEELKRVLTDLADTIHALEIKGKSFDNVRHGKAALRRMHRNAKIASHLADNAIAILVNREADVTMTVLPINRIVQPALVEVFDLLNPQTSEAIQSADSLAELNHLLLANELRLNLDADVWHTAIRCDADKVKQVLVNLLLNAFKFRGQWVRLEVKLLADRAVFCVIDDGRGISKQDQAYIFKHRFQVKSAQDFPVRGHGIGLAGAQALLECIDGHLELESEVDKETCFSAILRNIKQDNAAEQG